MAVRGFSPFGPIFAKELRVASRRRRNYLLRVLYLGGLLLFLLLAWSSTRESSGYYGGGIAARQQQQEQLGLYFFLFFSMFSVIAMALIGPVLTSTAINGERDAKTLHVLLMTPLTSWQIVSGKLFSRLLTALTLIGLSLPVLALVRLLGGVELGQMFGVIALSAVMAMTAAALGLVLSILIRRAYAVILLSYLLMGVVYLFIPMMVVMLWVAPASSRRASLPWMHLLAEYNPFWCTGALASGKAQMLGQTWVPCVIWHLSATAVLLLISALLLRRLARREGEGGPAAAEDVALPHGGGPRRGARWRPTRRGAAGEDELRGRGSAVLDAAGAVSAGAIVGAQSAPAEQSEPPIAAQPSRSAERKRRARAQVSDHPVLWRELRRPLMARRWQRAAGAVICVAMLGLTYFAAYSNNALGDTDTQIAYAWVFDTLLMLLACVLSATAIAQEKESEQWTVLLASPLSGAAIVWGKAFGVARRMAWPVALTVAHFLLFLAAGVISLPTFLMIMTVLLTFNLIWIATGVALSLRCRKVTVAVIINLALPLVLYGVTAMVLEVLDELSRGRGRFSELVEWWLPYYYLAEGVARGGLTGRPRLPGGDSVQGSQWEFLKAAQVIGLLHVLASAALLGATASRFNAIVGRASQLAPLESA